MIPSPSLSPVPSPTPTLPPLGPNEYVTWVPVDKETLDIVGVIVSSLSIAAICIIFATFCGSILGMAWIIRARRERRSTQEDFVSILPEPDPPPHLRLAPQHPFGVRSQDGDSGGGAGW